MVQNQPYSTSLKIVGSVNWSRSMFPFKALPPFCNPADVDCHFVTTKLPVANVNWIRTNIDFEEILSKALSNKYQCHQRYSQTSTIGYGGEQQAVGNGGSTPPSTLCVIVSLRRQPFDAALV